MDSNARHYPDYAFWEEGLCVYVIFKLLKLNEEKMYS